jgi:V/A-type H+-transporting ATPase subunit D
MSYSQTPISRGTLQKLREKLTIARRGKEVLEMRREQLVREVLLRAKKVEERATLDDKLYELFGKAVKLYLTLGEYEYRSVCSTIKAPKVEILIESLQGVRVPRVKIVEEPNFSTVSDPEVRQLADSLYAALREAITLAAEEERVRALASYLEYINRVTNSLEKIIIPQLEESIRYISERLEEEMINEFTILKKIRRSESYGELSSC